MSKTIKKCFYEKLTFAKMLEANERARVGKVKKREVTIFEMDLETNIIKIIDEIKSGEYKFGEYRSFFVYEPKERLIKSLPYRDRVVHQWFVEEFIKPYFFKRFIKDTYACLDGRGTHKAVSALQKMMRSMKREHESYYVLKCDVKKYFYSINKTILLNILKSRMSDKKLIAFSEKILNDGGSRGIPIGNFTSQYFANIYLNELDHYVKEKLRVKYYIRYMDDFVMLVPTKDDAKRLLGLVSEFLWNNLELELNAKSRYFSNKCGIDFCGYRIYETHILLRKRFKKKVKKKFKIWQHLIEEDKFLHTKFWLSVNSFKGHASHANSYNFVKKFDRDIMIKIPYKMRYGIKDEEEGENLQYVEDNLS